MKFSCEKCLYSTDSKFCFESHKKSKIHIQKENNEFVENFQCKICNKTYKSRVGLWRHKKKCEEEKKRKENEEMKNIVTQLLKDNKEMKNMLIEISKKEFTKIENIENIDNSQTNSNNKIDFNLFLNDKCKNAINMSSLIQDIIIGGQDIENIEKYGYVKTITDKLVSKIGGYSVYNIPIHYFIENRNKESNENDEDSEIQDTIHIKENDIWNTESISENEILLDNLNALNGALLDKSQNKPRAIQEIKSGKHYNRTELIMKDVLQSVEINDEKLQTL